MEMFLSGNEVEMFCSGYALLWRCFVVEMFLSGNVL